MFFPLATFGCSCFNEAKNFQDIFKEYDAIFTGIALNTEKYLTSKSSSFYKTEMKIQQVWKNKDILSSVFIKTNIERNSCGEPAPTIGNSFLIFAHLTADGLYATGGCSMFIDLEQIEKEISSLKPEEKLEWQTLMADMLIALGKPIIDYSQ